MYPTAWNTEAWWKSIVHERIHITIHLLHLQAGADQDMDMGNSGTPNMHALAHWDCRTMSRKWKDVLELVGHNRMLRNQCLESELYMNDVFKYKEDTMKT